MGQGTHRSSVHKYNDDDDQQDHYYGAYDVPLVVLPDDELERLPWGSEPEEGGGRTTVSVCMCSGSMGNWDVINAS